MPILELADVLALHLAATELDCVTVCVVGFRDRAAKAEVVDIDVVRSLIAA